MTKLLFTADDFGLSKGVNFGIIEAFQKGVVRNTSIMATGVAFDEAALLAKENPDLTIGIHLTLTATKSLGKGYKTLTDASGQFYGVQDFMTRGVAGLIDLDEVEAEYELQIHKVLAAGIQPVYFDSHHHSHELPGVFDIFLKMADKYQITKIRTHNASLLAQKNTDVNIAPYFEDGFYGDGANFEHLKHLITQFKGDSIEFMTHPAYLDATIYRLSSYNIPRMFELEILTGEELNDFIAQHDEYQIASYRDL